VGEGNGGNATIGNGTKGLNILGGAMGVTENMIRLFKNPGQIKLKVQGQKRSPMGKAQGNKVMYHHHGGTVCSDRNFGDGAKQEPTTMLMIQPRQTELSPE
jgi:hypothetical protein